MDKVKIANQIAEKFDGKVWTKNNDDGSIKICRVYLSKGYAQVNDNGVNIDAVGRSYYADLKDYLNSVNVANYRVVA